MVLVSPNIAMNTNVENHLYVDLRIKHTALLYVSYYYSIPSSKALPLTVILSIVEIT